MARWTRAARALQLPPGSRVLDLGCAFGFGTRLLARRYRVYGHDLSPAYIERARATAPDVTFTLGPADSVPYPDAFFDGVVHLDVLEHVPDERAVVDEIARVLKPDGTLVLSVPNRGALAAADSLNVYRRLLGDTAPPPTDDPSWPNAPRHHHYALADLRKLLAGTFEITAVRYTGLGVAEVVNLVLLLLLRRRAPRVYDAAQYLYFGVYLLEDLIPTGPWGYHLMVVARRQII